MTPSQYRLSLFGVQGLGISICHILNTVKTKIKLGLTTFVPGLLRRLYKSFGLGLAKVEFAEFVKHFFKGVKINMFKVAWIQA